MNNYFIFIYLYFSLSFDLQIGLLPWGWGIHYNISFIIDLPLNYTMKPIQYFVLYLNYYNIQSLNGSCTSMLSPISYIMFESPYFIIIIFFLFVNLSKQFFLFDSQFFSFPGVEGNVSRLYNIITSLANILHNCSFDFFNINFNSINI